jgi:mRNA interferase MazF
MRKDFDSWNTRKKLIQESSHPPYIHTREIWWASLGLNIGDEEDGKNERFERPVLVLRKFNDRIVLVVPLTTKPKLNRYHVRFDHEGMHFAALISQVRLISTRRCTRKIRRMDRTLFEHIRLSVAEMIAG